MGFNVFDLSAKITLDTSEYENGLTEASNKTSKFSESLGSIGKSVSTAGSTLTKAVTLPVVGLGTAVIKTGMDYQAGMSKVQAISGATGKEMEMLGEKAMEMAAKTKFSTADSASAYQFMAMAGWKAGDMVDGLSGIMNLAAASGENLGTTSDIVTDALTAFGLKAADSGRFADVLAAASNNANTNVSMLGESFKYVAPVAGALGYSVEDTSVALGLMANSGIKASQAGTSLRTAMTNMANPTKNMAAVMDEYGISLTDADGNMLSFAEIMGVLREKMGGLDEATQASAAATLFGKEAMSGMLAIINAAPEDFDKLTESINNSAGTTEKMANIMQDNAAGAFEKLKSAVDVLFTKLSGTLLPIFTKVVEKITEWVNWFGALDESTQKTILTIAGIAAAVGPVLIVVGKIITAISQIGSGISGLIGFVSKAGGAFSGLFSILAANPIALVIAAIAALVAGFVLLWNNCEDFRNFWIGLWDKVKEIASAAIDAIVGFFSRIIDFIKNNWQGILLFIVNPFAGAFKLIYDNCEAFRNFIDGLMETIKELFAAGWDAVKEFFASAWDAIVSIWDAAAGFFSGIGDGIKKTFSTVTEAVSGFFSKAWESVKGAWNAATGFFGGILDTVRGATETAANAIGNALLTAWNSIVSAWSSAVSFFSGIKGNIVSAFKNLVNSAKTWGKDMLQNFINGIGEKIGALVNKVKSVAQTVKDFLGFSEPKKGPLSNFHTYAPDMMQLFADGIAKNASIVQRQLDKSLNFDFETHSLSFMPSGILNGAAYRTAGNGPAMAYNGIGNTTVNIYSPEAVDAVQAAREWKKTTQRMAMGYV